MLQSITSFIQRSRGRLLALVVISFLMGCITFWYCAYKSATLVLVAKTLEKGQGRVMVEDTAGKRTSQTFEIHDRQGSKKMYVVELPASTLKSITVLPLASNGQFAVDRIIFSGAAGSYYWDEEGRCIRKSQRQGRLIREVCNSSSPSLTTSEDGSVVISSIPADEFINPGRARCIMSLIIALGTFLGGAWLLWPSRDSASTVGTVQQAAVRLSWLVVIILFIYRLCLVSRYSVDVPYEDEWEFFPVSALSQDLSWQWLFRFHVEHRIVLTKLLAWLNLKLFGLDFVLQNFINMFEFGCLLVVLAGFKNRVAGRAGFKLFPFFMIFLLSSIAYENQLWAFQSQYHLVLLFSLVALYHAYDLRVTCFSALMFSLCMLLAMYSFSAGVVFAVTSLLCISIFIVTGIAKGRVKFLPGVRFLLVISTILITGLLFWGNGYVTPAWSPQKLSPTDVRFWDFYLNMISFGFGFSDMHILPGLACLFLILFPLGLLLYRQETRWQPSTWQVLTAITSILAALAAISIGRGGFGLKLSRHAEVAFMLIPYAALAWWLAIRGRGMRIAILFLLWFFCFAGYFKNWSTQKYAEFKQINLLTLECVEAYYGGSGDGACQGRTTSLDLDRAKEMGAKFTRQFLSTAER